MGSESVEVLHISDCLEGGVPAVIDTLLLRPKSRALFLGPLSAKLANAERCSSMPEYARTFNPVRMALMLVRLRAKIREIDPKLIHLHSSYAGLLGALVSLVLRRPVVYTPHASPMMIPNPGRKLRIVRHLEKITASLSSCVIACSRDEASHFKWLRRPALVIPNGVPDAVRAGLGTACAEGFSFDVLGIGRDSLQKDLEQFSTIADEVIRHYPGARIAWVGAGRRAGLSDKVDWLGFVGESEVSEILKRSRIFLATSVYEGLSVAGIKAAMAGCEVILRDKPGTRSLSDSGLSCRIYADPQDCAATIVKLLDGSAKFVEREAMMLQAGHLYSQARQLRRTDRLYKLFLQR